MSDLDVLLKSIPLYINLDEARKLQSGPDAIENVSTLVQSVIDQLASELLGSVAAELTQSNVQGCVKDQTKAEELRVSGNALFAKGDFLAACRYYSESLRFTDQNQLSSADLCAKLYGNRALCLSKLERHAEAEEDANSALEFDPSNAKYFYRRAVVRKAQKKLLGAEQDAEKAVKLLQEQGGDTADAEALLNSLRKCRVEPIAGDKGGEAARAKWDIYSTEQWTTHSVPQDLWADDEDATDKSTEGTKKEPLRSGNYCGQCSVEYISHLAQQRALNESQLKVQEVPIIGRQLVVCESLSNGTDIFRDQPVAWALQKRQRLQCCNHCCKELPLDGALYWSCGSCALVVYCSKECRDSCDAQHAAEGPECGRPWTALLPPEVVLAVRLACRLKRPITKQQKGVEDLHDINKNAAEGLQAALIASSLGTHFSEMTVDDAVHDATVACAAHAAWSLASERTRSNYLISAADVLRALCIIRVNGIALVPRAFASKEDSIGLGIYPVASFLTHSCMPNTSLRFEGNVAIARTLKDLPAGAALTHSYGAQAGEMTTAQRRLMLLEQYHFLCKCEACNSAEEAAKEAEMVGLKCTTKGCEGALPVPVSAEAGLASKYDLNAGEDPDVPKSVCSGCGAAMEEAEWRSRVAPRLSKALQAYSSGCQALESGAAGGDLAATKQGLKLLEESLSIREELLHRNNQVLGATHNALSFVGPQQDQGSKGSGSVKIEDQIMHCRASLQIAERLYPANSTNVAFEKLKLGTMLQSVGKIEQGQVLVSDAMHVMERHYGTINEDLF